MTISSKHLPQLMTKEDAVFPTITTRVGDIGNWNPYMKIKNNTKQGYLTAEDGDGIDISSRMEHHRGTVQKGMSQTLTTAGGQKEA